MEITSSRVTIKTADGSMDAHQCVPGSGGPHPAIIVIMEAFGVNSHIKDVTERIAKEGYLTIAPDLYYRQSGERTFPYTDMKNALGMMATLKDDKVTADVGAVLSHLKSQSSVNANRIGMTGFCMGGRVTYLMAAKYNKDIKTAVAFYGGGIGADDPNAPVNFTAQISCPIQCNFGEKDMFIPLDQVKKIEEALKKNGKTYEVKVYDGAGHGFFCNDRPSYHESSAKDAWERFKTWFKKYL